MGNFDPHLTKNTSGAIHKLCNIKGGGGPSKCYHIVFLVLKLIKIWTKSVTCEKGVKRPFWALHNSRTVLYIISVTDCAKFGPHL